MRYYDSIAGKQVLKGIRCDRCQEMVDMTSSGYEVATLTASFEKEPHCGDRFMFDFCTDCFDDIAETVLLIDEGTCHYKNVYNETSFDDILAAYSLRINIASTLLCLDEDE